MTSMKVVQIPLIENFANLIVYPSEQKVTNKQNKKELNFQTLFFRERVLCTSSMGCLLNLAALRIVCKLSFCQTMSTACFPPLAVPLALSQCTQRCLK